MDRKEKEKILEELETKDSITKEGMAYFLCSGTLYVLPCEEFKSRSLFYENNSNLPFSYYKYNLTFGSQRIEDIEALDKIKIETVYQSNAVTAWKISNYPPSLDYQDIDVKKLFSARGETLEDLKRQEKDSWLSEFALKVRDYLRKIMQ